MEVHALLVCMVFIVRFQMTHVIDLGKILGHQSVMYTVSSTASAHFHYGTWVIVLDPAAIAKGTYVSFTDTYICSAMA